MKSLCGQLLVAEPRLADSNFFRSVVLVLEHAEQGASGLILNRPGSVQLSEIWSNVSESPLKRDETIFIGGPVQGPLTILHDQLDFAERPILDGLNLSMKRENLEELLASEDAAIRVFSGYSGWAPGQLERECETGGWLIWPAKSEDAFHDPDTHYKSVCDAVGQDILFGKSPPRHRPEDPTMN